MVLSRINGKYNLKVKNMSKAKLIKGLMQIAQMLKEENDNNEDALFITDLIDSNKKR